MELSTHDIKVLKNNVLHGGRKNTQLPKPKITMTLIKVLDKIYPVCDTHSCGISYCESKFMNT